MWFLIQEDFCTFLCFQFHTFLCIVFVLNTDLKMNFWKCSDYAEWNSEAQGYFYVFIQTSFKAYVSTLWAFLINLMPKVELKGTFLNTFKYQKFFIQNQKSSVLARQQWFWFFWNFTFIDFKRMPTMITHSPMMSKFRLIRNGAEKLAKTSVPSIKDMWN